MKTRRIKIDYTDGTSETTPYTGPTTRKEFAAYARKEQRFKRELGKVVSAEGDIDFAGLVNVILTGKAKP